MTMKKNRTILLFLVVTLLIMACNDQQPQPKPHGYFRITLPEKSYQTYEGKYVAFRYPEYAQIITDPLGNNKDNWLDIDFSQFNAKIHVSYRPVINNFDTLTEDARAMALKHIPKSSGIRQLYVENDEEHVYGLIYDISGTGAASPCQFFVSDTTSRFLRGALYFNLMPNNDSLAPVIDFLRQDIDTLIYSLEWR